MKKFYVTTPIYYVNDRPHIGSAYTTVLADVLAGYRRMLGDRTFFLTGTDEHGQKVQNAAAKRGVPPKEHCDETCLRFKEAWEALGIEYNRFIRTTDPDHEAFVQEMLLLIHEKGDVYASTYEGYYCVSCERFFTKKDVTEGLCPEKGCGKPVQWIEEKNYFFRMSRYQDWLVRTIEENPAFIFPETRKNEVLGFLRNPLEDLCISRPKSRLAWGIELPFDRDYVTYVWFDALLNYVSGVRGIGGWWPADLHLIGKDILITHSVYWPIMLKAMDLPLPATILAHGWWTMKDRKMGKSAGNAVNPMEMIGRHGVDAFRYFLMREMVLGQDCEFSEEGFVARINSDLANDLGNMLSRIVRFSLSKLPGPLEAPAEAWDDESASLRKRTGEALARIGPLLESFKLSSVAEEAIDVTRAINRFFEVRTPWQKLKTDPAEARRILAFAAEALRIAMLMLRPIMPGKTAEALRMLGASNRDLCWSEGKLSFIVQDGPSLFPRVMPEEAAADKPGEAAKRDAPQKAEKTAKPPEASKEEAKPPRLVGASIIRGLLESVENHPNADKLFRMSVNDGTRSRSVCAGLRKHFTAEELRGRRAALVANLKPAMLRGVLSEGMLLAAQLPDGGLDLVDPQEGPVGEAFRAEGALPDSPEITIEEFGRLSLRVKGGTVMLGDAPLLSESGGRIVSKAPDGSQVR